MNINSKKAFNFFEVEKIESLLLRESLEFKKEEKIKKEGFHSLFTIYPFERGIGHMIGLMIRRLSLSNLMEGNAICAARIEGVSNMFCPLPTAKEDVIDFIMNLKKVRVKKEDVSGPVELHMNLHKEGNIYAKDIECPAGVTITNPDQYLCYLNDSGRLKASFLVMTGKGYVEADDFINAFAEESENSSLDPCLFLDSRFNCVLRINFSVTTEIVKKKLDYEKLIIDLETDGTISPADVIKYIIEYLLKLLLNISYKEISKEFMDDKSHEKSSELQYDKVMFYDINELNLGHRAMRRLSECQFNYIGDIVTKTRDDLKKIPGFGDTTVKEIEDSLHARNVSLGMHLPNWPPKDIHKIYAELKRSEPLQKNKKTEEEDLL